jgi:hypothetical protein
MTTQNPTPIDVSPRQLSGLITHAFRANVPLMIWGDGGLGKSRIAEQTSADAGRRYCDFRALIKDLPDLQGYPIVSDMRPCEPAPMTAPADLPPSNSPDAWTLVLEELPGAPRMMQGALYGLILERRLNSYTLPTNTRIIATGNMATSGGVIQAMPKPLANRMMHCRLICTPDEHLAHAHARDWHPFITAYHTLTKGAEWSNFDAKSPEETYASPRSWEMVSDALHAGQLPADLITPVFSGLLGYGIGQKFAAFVRLYSDLAPTIATMRQDPECCPIPNDAAIQWFFAAHIAADKAGASQDPAGFARFAFPFLRRLPDELCVFAVDTLTRHTPQLARTPEFRHQFATNPRFAALAQYCK